MRMGLRAMILSDRRKSFKKEASIINRGYFFKY